MKPSELTQVFRCWLNVRWVHQGRTRYGVDCGGLIVCALKQAGLRLGGFTDPVAYSRAPKPVLRALVEQHLIPTFEPEEGTIALIRFSPSLDPSHLAYLTGRNMIHASSTGARAVVEHRYGEPWVRQTVGIFRIPGVSYT